MRWGVGRGRGHQGCRGRRQKLRRRGRERGGSLALQRNEPCCDGFDAVRLQERRAEGHTGLLHECVRQVVCVLLRTAGEVNYDVG